MRYRVIPRQAPPALTFYGFFSGVGVFVFVGFGDPFVFGSQIA